MTPPENEFKLLMLCQDQVQELPPDSRVLAHRRIARWACLPLGGTMLGIQAHPEFPKDYVSAIIQDREQRIGEAKTARCF